MGLLSFWAGYKFGKGEGADAILILGFISVLFIMIFAFFMFNVYAGLFVLVFILIFSVLAILTKNKKRDKR